MVMESKIWAAGEKLTQHIVISNNKAQYAVTE
jgi:hypothetical protein